MKAYTDYPFTALGDKPYKNAPIRGVRALSYDGNKYCTVEVDGQRAEVKAGYLYTRAGRCGEVPTVAEADLLRLPRAA
jgi:hypothetical protein